MREEAQEQLLWQHIGRVEAKHASQTRLSHVQVWSRPANVD